MNIWRHQFTASVLILSLLLSVACKKKVAGGPLPEKEVLRLGVQLAEGLAAAYDHGVVHRDLKPGNLQVTSDGRLKILDFGLAKLRLPVTDNAATESLSETQAMAGTLPYMAPEQLLGEAIDACTDIHAAGSVLYEMATGQRPFADIERSQLIGAILRRPPRSPAALNPGLSPELERIIGKCLEKEPADRYQSAKELAIDLRRLQTGVVSAVHLAARPARWSFTKSVGLGLGVLASVIVLLIALNVGSLRERVLGRTGAPRIKSLAVLPVKNFSGDPAQDFFADGMTDALIDGLAQIEAVKVISRTSVMHYKGSSQTLPQIAKELGVDGIIEASVMRSGSRVRITARLIEARDDRHLWAGNYEREMTDVLALQSELVQAIAGEIRGTLLMRRTTKAAGSREIAPGIYEEYLLGRYEWNKRTPEGTSAALEHFKRVIAQDPGYAPAYSGLADCYVTLWLSIGALSRDQALPQAQEALRKALLLDPDLADAHSTLGMVRMYADWDWTGAEAEFKQAIALNPNYATARHWYGLYLAFRGQTDEARQELERAHELDPLSSIIQLNLAWVQFVAGHTDALIAASQKELASDASFWDAHWDLGTAYVQQGEMEKGIAELQKAVELSHNSAATLSSLGYALGRAGRRTQAEQVLRELQERSQHEPVAAEEIAMVYIGLGDSNHALLWLEQAYRDHSKGLVMLKADPWYRSLAAEPRYQQLLRQVGVAGR